MLRSPMPPSRAARRLVLALFRVLDPLAAFAARRACRSVATRAARYQWRRSGATSSRRPGARSARRRSDERRRCRGPARGVQMTHRDARAQLERHAKRAPGADADRRFVMARREPASARTRHAGRAGSRRRRAVGRFRRGPTAAAPSLRRGARLPRPARARAVPPSACGSPSPARRPRGPRRRTICALRSRRRRRPRQRHT